MQPEPKNTSVPWTGLDVLLFLFLWFWLSVVSGIAAGVASIVMLSPPNQTAVLTENDEEKDHGHPLFQMIKQSNHSPPVLVIAFLAVVIAAPLMEEFLFRLLLQGWLEAKLAQIRVPFATGIAIVAVSLFFAAIHGGNSSPMNWKVLAVAFGVFAMTSPLLFVLGIVYLKWMWDVKMTHCLFGTSRFFHPQFLPVAGWCLLALTATIGISGLLNVFYPNTNTDPIPIFVFSLLLGILYSRTRNLSYCILLHALLNGTSLTIAWFSV